MSLWVALGVAQLMGYLWAAALSPEPPVAGRVLAAVEHQIEPVVVVGVVWSLAKALPSERLFTTLRRALNALVSGLCLNSLLAAWLIGHGGMGPLVAWLPPATRGPGSVWSAAIEMGRYGGIFNQPFEGGLSYSLALLAWYRLQGPDRAISLWEYGRLALLLFGGVASVSKVFLFCGVPVFVVYALARRPHRKLVAITLLSVGLVFAFHGPRQGWSGFPLLASYFHGTTGTDRLSLYTGNRFGRQPTQVEREFSEVWRISPVVGFGFAPLPIQDNSLLWAFAGGGLVGAGIFTTMLCGALARTARMVRRTTEQIFAFLMLVLMLAAAVGAPAFTIDRGSTIFWTIFPLGVLAGFQQERLRSGDNHRKRLNRAALLQAIRRRSTPVARGEGCGYPNRARSVAPERSAG